MKSSKPAIYIASFLLCLLWAAALWAQQGGNKSQPRQIRVAVDGDHPPFMFVDSNGHPQGYEADMWRLFERHTGIKIKIMPQSWVQAQQAVVDGRADVLGIIYSDTYRADQFDFTPSYVSMPISVFVAKGLEHIKSADDLLGYVVGVEAGSPCIRELQELGITNVHENPRYQEVMQGALNGDYQAFCMPRNSAIYHLYRNAAINQYQEAFLVTEKRLYRAVKKGNEKMRSTVSQGMAKISKSERQWLAERWLEEPRQIPVYLQKIALMASIILVAAVVLVIWVILLRRSVRRHTKWLAREQTKLRALFDSSPDAVWVKNQQGSIVEANERAAQLFQLPVERLVGLSRFDLFDGINTQRLRSLERRMVRSGHLENDLFEVDTSAGPERILEVSKAPLKVKGEGLIGIVTIARDITSHVRFEREQRLAAVAFQGQSAMLVLDANGVIQRANQEFCELTDYAEDEIIGRSVYGLNVTHEQPAFSQQLFIQAGIQGGGRYERWIQGKADAPKLVQLVATVVLDANQQLVSHYVVSMLDLTQEQEVLANMDRLRFFDTLTNLPNKNFLRSRLQQIVSAPSQQRRSLIFIDLDHFKKINDIYGYKKADELLVLVAQRLQLEMSAPAALFRYSGGTFVMIWEFNGIDDTDTLNAKTRLSVKKIQALLKEPITLVEGQTPVNLTVSMGWTLLSTGETEAEQVIKEAELAMYHAKDLGRDRVQAFKPELLDEIIYQQELISDLGQAIEKGELKMAIQPQVNRNGRYTGGEALVRWTRQKGDKQEVIPPSVFIPLAEKNNLVVQLGLQMLEKSCAQLAEWQQDEYLKDLTLSVNVSAKQLVDNSFTQDVIRIITASGINPKQLKLEVTETAILENIEEMAAKLEQLHRLGIKICLDDFGTGYASLMYLSHLPIDQIKIDRSFVSKMHRRANDRILVRASIGLGHGLGMQVVAEGIETPTQKQQLLKYNCDIFQGFLFSKPLTPERFKLKATANMKL